MLDGTTALATASDMVVVENSLRHGRCPVCNAPDLSPLGPVSYGQDVAYASTPVRLSATPELWQCVACGSWFTQNAVHQTDSARLYANGAADRRWKAPPFDISKSREILAVISDLVTPGSHVIDVGCNTGELLDYCKSLQAAHTCGIELSRSSALTCRKKGHAVLESLTEVAEKVDFIFAFDLVEHLYDFRAFVSRVAALLKPGGKFVVLTGDNSSITARRFQNRWWYVSYPEHVLFPSRDAWAALQEVRLVRAVRTYASKGYKSSPRIRARATAALLLRRGNGLPLPSGDHHLLVLEKPRNAC